MYNAYKMDGWMGGGRDSDTKKLYLVNRHRRMNEQNTIIICGLIKLFGSDHHSVVYVW